MRQTRALRLLVACTIAAGILGGQQAHADGPCSRLAANSDDITDPGGALYTDQRVGGRLDFTGATFARSGTDLAIELRIDDFTEPHVAGSRSEYYVDWQAPGASAVLSIVDESGTWSFSARRSGDLFTELANVVAGDLILDVVGSVDEDAGIISALVKDVLPAGAGGGLAEVNVGSAEGRRLVFPGYIGDAIPNRFSGIPVDLDADCTSPPDPLPAWCRELDDDVGEIRELLPPNAPGQAKRIDLTRVEFLPSGVDLTALISVDDLDGPRTDHANARRFWLDASVSGLVLSVYAYEIDDVWSGNGTLGEDEIPVSVSADADANLITIDVPGTLLQELPRYLKVIASSSEGIGATTPVGAIYPGLSLAADSVYPHEENLSRVIAIDLDAACP